MSGQALAIHDVTPVIHPHRVKYTFGDIDPEDVHLLLHWTRLLWLNGFTDLELIVAHCSRSAQGRVHFITTTCFLHAVCLIFYDLQLILAYMGEDGDLPQDNLDLERWFRQPKGHERRIHGHRHVGVRL